MTNPALHNKDGKHPQSPDGWIDIGALDFEAAKANRERIADKRLNAEYWQLIKNRLEAVPFGQPIPRGIPIGDLPQVSKQRERIGGEEEND